MIILALLSASLASPTTIIPLRSIESLKQISDCLDCQYVLLNDIALDERWVPIGTAAAPFSGVLDGKGNSIFFEGFAPMGNRTIGLFSVMLGATVYNLHLHDSTHFGIPTPVTDFSFGLLAGKASFCHIYGCSVEFSSTMNINNHNFTIGGFFGTADDSIISRCSAELTLDVLNVKNLYLGGISGNISSTYINDTVVKIACIVDLAQIVIVGGLIGVSTRGTATSAVLGGVPESSMVNRLDNGTSIVSCSADANIILRRTTESTVGGVVAAIEYLFRMANCSILFSFQDTGRRTHYDLSVGGVTGCTFKGNIEMQNISINATIDASADHDGLVSIQAGCLLGSMYARQALINQVFATCNITVTGVSIWVGGLIGYSDMHSGTIRNSGVIGTISAGAKNIPRFRVGGFLGSAIFATITQCFFVGSIRGAEQSNDALFLIHNIGGFSAEIYHSTLTSCYALANVSTSGGAITAGTVGLLVGSTITSCYAAVNITISSSISLLLGGMIGLMSSSTKVIDSFVVTFLVVNGCTSNLTLGGFIGYINDELGGETILGCYAWGFVEVLVTPQNSTTIGGFIGTLNGSSEVALCIAYVNFTSMISLKTGLFIGEALLYATGPDVLTTQRQVQFTVAYVAPQGSLAHVSFVGRNTGIAILDSYCAHYENTNGCIPLELLNTKRFLKEFDFISTFQFSDAIANGSVALQNIPVPLTISKLDMPRFEMPDISKASHWPSSHWSVHDTVLRGFPYLNTIDKVLLCSSFLGCHGIGTSPVDAICNKGWSSPNWNETALIDNIHRCNIFRCKTSAECHDRGVCMYGVCRCNPGSTGTDCSQLICPELGGQVCGFNECMPFSKNSDRGVCRCQPTEFLTNAGLCKQACQPIGFGVCQEFGNVACFQGYSLETGCLEYNCSSVTVNVCHGTGTCTDGKCACTEDSIFLGGNCYRNCVTNLTFDCLYVSCGESNACAGHGLCVPDFSESMASCVCNVDQNGKPTETHFGGTCCDICQVGYALHDGDCVKDKCPRCDGGKCQYSATEKAIVCTCERDHTAMDGECVHNSCGKCNSGDCMPIPGGIDFLSLFCICNTEVADKTCYVFDCLRCANGYCTPDNEAMRIECTCPSGTILNTDSGTCEWLRLSIRVLTIVSCVVSIGSAAVAATVALVCVLRRRKRLAYQSLLIQGQ